MTSLGLLVALPSFVAMFYTRDWSFPVLALVVGFVAVLAGVVMRWFMRLPAFTVVSHNVTCEIVDDHAHEARMRKEYEIRPNYGHLSSITFRNIAGDGRISKIAWNGDELPPAAIKRRMEEYIITVDFPHALPRWKTFSGVLSYRCEDTFPEKNEGIVYTPDFPTVTACITVTFPPNRKWRDPGASRLEGSGEKAIKTPHVSADKKSISITLKRPKPGEEYALFWVW
ncbi:MAG TPA: hypothetical protein VGQ65_23770 [Thermoanaerobaculia bacterium]|nr:hypothetical protein [Thermoanaerobaculia bacterium]